MDGDLGESNSDGCHEKWDTILIAQDGTPAPFGQTEVLTGLETRPMAQHICTQQRRPFKSAWFFAAHLPFDA